MMSRILIVGGAGYIGSHLARKLLEDMYKIDIIDNFSTSSMGNLRYLKSHFSNNLEFYNQDIRTCDWECIALKEYSHVVHLAGFKSVPESFTYPNKYYENNVGGTLNLLNYLSKKKIPNFLFASSCTIYGNVGQANEDIEPNPISPYGISKLLAEEAIKYICGLNNINYYIFRFFNVAGNSIDGKIGDENKYSTMLIPSLFRASYTGDKFRIYGNKYSTKDGTCIRDYIHVLDIVDAFVKAINNNNLGANQIINLGINKGYSVLEVIHTFQKLTKRNIHVEIFPSRKGDAEAITAGVHNAKKILEWQPKFDLKDMISLMDKWYSRASIF